MNLEGKVAIITGARRGIGRSIALAFAKAGADVVVSDIDIKDCEKVAKEIESSGRRVLVVKTDVTNYEEVDHMVKSTLEKFGKIDVLVNNAGILIYKPFLEITEDIWDKTLNTNLKGYFLCAQRAAKEMVKQKKGKIINIASVAGEVAYPQIAHYCASKGGVIMLTKVMATELAPYKINVNTISPGAIETPMTQGMLSDPKTREENIKNIPWGRIGKPEDIANIAVFLASDNADYLTGANVVVDGGMTTHG